MDANNQSPEKQLEKKPENMTPSSSHSGMWFGIIMFAVIALIVVVDMMRSKG